MFEYKTSASEPDDIIIDGDALYDVNTRSVRINVKYRFGIADLGGSWEYWEYEKREAISGVDTKNMANVTSEIQALYTQYSAIYTDHSSNLSKVKNFDGAVIPVP